MDGEGGENNLKMLSWHVDEDVADYDCLIGKIDVRWLSHCKKAIATRPTYRVCYTAPPPADDRSWLLVPPIRSSILTANLQDFLCNTGVKTPQLSCNTPASSSIPPAPNSSSHAGLNAVLQCFREVFKYRHLMPTAWPLPRAWHPSAVKS